MAEESKQSGSANDGSKSNRSISGTSSSLLEDGFPDLEDSLDFDIYVDDIPLIAEASADLSQTIDDPAIKNVIHFSDPDSGSSEPIPLNLSSFREETSDDYPELDSKPFSEDDLDDILLKDDSNASEFEEDGAIALSSDELDNITSEDENYSTDYEDSLQEADFSPSRGNSQFTSDETDESDQLNDTYDTELSDDESITLGSDELDHILNPDETEEEEESENEFETKSFFDNDSEEVEEEGPIALSPDELNNITDSDYSDTDNFETEDFITDSSSNLFDETDSEEDEESIALSGDELNNLLESGNEGDETEEEFADGEAKSFFDSEEEEDDSIALSSDELNNITDSEYPEEGIETDDLSSGIESNEYGVSTASMFDEENSLEDENISLSGDELNNILETGEIEVEGEPEEDLDSEETKSFFDSETEEEEDDSIALSPDELGNITAEEDFETENVIDDSLTGEDNFDLSESTQDLDMESSSDLFQEDAVEDEEIALSGDELNNLLESGEIETEEADSMGTSLFEDATEEDESIALSPDELGNITAEEDFETENVIDDSLTGEDNFDLSESTQDLDMESSSDLFQEDAVEDEEIALSGDELNNLLESGEIETEEADSMGTSLFEDATEEDESIALSPDELGNITAEEDFETENVTDDSLTGEDNFDLSGSNDDFQMESPSNLFGDSGTEDEEIALSGDELENILESGEIETEEAADNTATIPAADYDNPIDSGMVIGDDDFVLDDNSSLSSLEDFDLGDSSLGESTSEESEIAKDYSENIDSFQFGLVKKEELKKVISYMDELLGSLPDSYIKEFASSEYFELYKKIMNELEL